MVLYSSGTTGRPKGILISNRKHLDAARLFGTAIALTADDVGYPVMPMSHANSLVMGVEAALVFGAAVAIPRPRFSATSFVADVLAYGVTSWNFVGQTMHYVVTALEAGLTDDERVAVAQNSRNRLRTAIGNGPLGGGHAQVRAMVRH